MPKLMKIRAAEALTVEAILAYKAKLKENRATLPVIQTVTDADLKVWEKMGPVKREEYGKVLDVFLENNDHLQPPTMVQEAQNHLVIYDGSDELIAAHEAEIVFLKRRKMIAGAISLNILKTCEADTDYLANKENEKALIAQIELNKLVKTTRGSSANKKTDEPTDEKPK